MAINSTNPIVVDGNTYPHYLVNLAISPYQAPHGASVSLKLTPYRFLSDGTIQSLEEHSKAVSLLDVFAVAEHDPAFEKAIEGIMNTLQTFINDKGL